ncbi:S1 RNA-binding domain-containing protein [Streptomyces sp. XHT-2]|uniref:S1 RNA-binding domain-containing protein n=1 Tax=Streptomyces sp. XHT-2 TaxID=2692621 RepID=UPI00136D2D8A|nr:S1 RNA-binding domain-containing protein [Streptomyces sp. XHT-2]
MALKLRRESGRAVDEDLVFFLMPYGKKKAPDGHDFDFNVVYQELAEVVTGMGMRPERADENEGTATGPLDAAWDGVDRAGIVVVDLSVPSTSVAMELGWAMCLHKRMVVVMYEGADVPTNVVGRLRPIQYTRELEKLRKLRTELRVGIEAARLSNEPEMDLLERSITSGAFEATARVEIAYPDRIFVRDVQDPLRSAEMRREDVSYWDMVPEDMSASKNYRQGAYINGFFVIEQGRVTFSQRYREVNPWPRLVATYQPRQICTARVTKVRSGAFVELQPEGGRSFIPPYQARAANLAEGDEIQVRILKVDPQQRRIDVDLAEAPNASPMEPPAGEYPAEGDQLSGKVFDTNVERGYVRVRLDGYSRLGLLHYSKMSPLFWDAVRSGVVIPGFEVKVKVSQISPSRRRVAQWDIALEQVVEQTAETEPSTEQTAADGDESPEGAPVPN